MSGIFSEKRQKDFDNIFETAFKVFKRVRWGYFSFYSNWVISFQKSCDLERKFEETSFMNTTSFIFINERNIIGFCWCFFRRVSKMRFTCPWDFFEREQFFWDSLICFSFNVRTLSYKLSVFCREVFGRLFKTAFKVFTRNNWGFLAQKSHVLKINFGQYVEVWSLLVIVFFWQNSENCILSLHGNILMEIISFDHRVFDSISNAEKEDQSSVFGRLVKTAFYVSKENLWEKKAVFWMFWDLSENFPTSGKKDVVQGCQNCNLCA